MRRVRVLLLAVLVVASAGLAACGSGNGSTSGSASGSASAPAEQDKTHASFDAAAANTKVTVKAVEYAFQVTPAQAVGPKVFFEVTNGGTEKHEFEVLGPDGKRVDEIVAFDPGKTKTLPVELAPGTYTIQCLLTKNGKTHASLGMSVKYTVT